MSISSTVKLVTAHSCSSEKCLLILPLCHCWGSTGRDDRLRPRKQTEQGESGTTWHHTRNPSYPRMSTAAYCSAGGGGETASFKKVSSFKCINIHLHTNATQWCFKLLKRTGLCYLAKPLNIITNCSVKDQTLQRFVFQKKCMVMFIQDTQ